MSLDAKESFDSRSHISAEEPHLKEMHLQQESMWWCCRFSGKRGVVEAVGYLVTSSWREIRHYSNSQFFRDTHRASFYPSALILDVDRWLFNGTNLTSHYAYVKTNDISAAFFVVDAVFWDLFGKVMVNRLKHTITAKQRWCTRVKEQHNQKQNNNTCTAWLSWTSGHYARNKKAQTKKNLKFHEQ